MKSCIPRTSTGRAVLRTAVLLGLAAVAPSYPARAAAAEVVLAGQLPFDPRPALDFKAAANVLLPPTGWKAIGLKDGATFCGADGWCMIPDMPVLHQTDHDVVKALAAALAALIEKSYPDAPLVKDAATGKMVKAWQQDGSGKFLSPSEIAQGEADVGCSLTAQTMLVDALLARAPKNAVPTARTKEYVDSNLAPDLPKDKSRLAWQYLQHLIAMRQGQKNGPGLLTVAEAAGQIDDWKITPVSLALGSDGGPDDLKAVKTDFTKYSMSSMADDIRHGGLTRLNFHWSRIGIVTTADGTTHVVRMDVGQHKIALRGFSEKIEDRVGAYPILANDPGSGNLVKIRLTTDVKAFDVGKLDGKVEYDFYDASAKKLIVLGSQDPGWMAMVYEGFEPDTQKAEAIDVGLGKRVQFSKIQFVNGVVTTFTAPPPADAKATRQIAERPYFPVAVLRPSSGPVEGLGKAVAPSSPATRQAP